MKSFILLIAIFVAFLEARLIREVVITSTYNPFPRDAFAATSRGNEIFVFFGGVQNFSTQTTANPNGNYACYNDVARLTLEHDGLVGHWDPIPATGDVPSNRSFTEAATVQDLNGQDWILLYGGNKYEHEHDPSTFYDSGYLFNPDTFEFVNISSITPNPGPRNGHIMVADDSKVWLFNGINTANYHVKGDVWEFDINDRVWQQIDSSDTPGRFAGVGALFKSRGVEYLVQSLGETFTPTFAYLLRNTTVSYSLSDDVFSDITPTPNFPIGRTWAAYAGSRSGDSLMVHGGDDRTNNQTCGKLPGSGDTTTQNDFWFFTTEYGWVQYFPTAEDSFVEPRKQHKAPQVGRYAYIMGGFSCDGDIETFPTGVIRVYNP
jgi:hypothetical protein